MPFGSPRHRFAPPSLYGASPPKRKGPNLGRVGSSCTGHSATADAPVHLQFYANRDLLRFCNVQGLAYRPRIVGLRPHLDRLAQGQFLLLRLGRLVGTHNSLYESVTHHIRILEVTEANALNSLEDVDRVQQSRFTRIGKVDLCDVSCNHRLGTVAHACEEHLHLLDRGILRLVHDDESVIERAPTHESERSYFDDVFLQHLVDLFGSKQVIEGVIKRTQIRIDFLLQGSGQESELFTGLDGGPNEHDAAYFFGVHGGYRHSYGKVGFPGASRTYAKGHIVLLDGLNVLSLINRPRLHSALHACGALFAGVGQRAQSCRRISDHQA